MIVKYVKNKLVVKEKTQAQNRITNVKTLVS